MKTYSQRDFHEAWRQSLNDRRQVYMVSDTLAAFVAGISVGALGVLFWLVVTGGV